MNEQEEQKYNAMLGRLKHILDLPKTTDADVAKLCARLIADYCETGEQLDYIAVSKKVYDVLLTLVLLTRAQAGKND